MKRPLRILVATRDARVLDALPELEKAAGKTRLTLAEALSTDGVYQELASAHLAIVDFEALCARKIKLELLRQVWERLEIPHCASAEFLAEPPAWLARALAAAGSFQSLPPQQVLFTSYSGGVGKTTLALDLALYFAAATKLPVALVELTRGPSALRAVTGVSDGADLYDAATRGMPPATWRGVTLVPYDDDTCGLTPLDAARAFLVKLTQEHVLTLADVEIPHPFLELFADARQFILASPKPDAWVNAARLKTKFPEARVVFNMVRGVGDKVAQAGIARDLDLPWLNEVRLDGALAKRVLPLIYPGWKEH